MSGMLLSDVAFVNSKSLLQNGIGLIPIGATEAHGPHLPISTDVIIAQAMAREAGVRLEAKGLSCSILPPLAYSVTEYAGGFSGTVSIRPETASAVLLDIARSLSRQGVKVLGIANGHLEPAHIASLETAVVQIREEKLLAVAFPDVTRKPWALRLTEEFKSGACHAGRYEGSIVLAERPDLVDEKVMRSLPPNPASLAKAIRDGKKTFEEAGGKDAYFGWPAEATAEEGRATVKVLGGILEEAVLAALA